MIARFQAAILIISKLSRAVDPTPESRLMFAIWAQALKDAYSDIPEARGVDPVKSDEENARAFRRWEQRCAEIHEARAFIAHDTYALEMAGLDPEYARRVMRTIGNRLPVAERLN